MHSARLFCRLFCARFFSSAGSRGRGGREAWQLAGAYSILNFCHFAMSIVVVPPSPPCWQWAPNWLLFNRDATSVSCGLLHILCISCPQIAVHPAPHPSLPPAPLCTLAVGRKSPKILFIMSPYRQQQLCLSLHFGLLCLPHSSPRLPACLVVCFCRASERFAHLPVYMCCAVVYCSQWAWQGARETVIKRASAVACCHIKLPIYFLGLQQQRCNLATFCATDKFLCISYGSPPPPSAPPPATLKGAKSRCAF